MSPLGTRSLRLYGAEDRFCLFLTGPVWPSVSDGVMFIRSSRVVMVNFVVENAESERKNEKKDESGRQE